MSPAMRLARLHLWIATRLDTWREWHIRQAGNIAKGMKEYAVREAWRATHRDGEDR